MKDTTFRVNNNICPGEKMLPTPCEMAREYVTIIFDSTQWNKNKFINSKFQCTSISIEYNTSRSMFCYSPNPSILIAVSASLQTCCSEINRRDNALSIEPSEKDRIFFT